jgi:hypothetical protein
MDGCAIVLDRRLYIDDGSIEPKRLWSVKAIACKCDWYHSLCDLLYDVVLKQFYLTYFWSLFHICHLYSYRLRDLLLM